MINLTDSNVFECDAVIIATPAPQAYGILQTAQDEIPARRIIRHIDEVAYSPAFSLSLVYEKQDMPEWKAIECEDDRISWIINESSKRNNKYTAVELYSTGDFTREHHNGNPAESALLMMERASEISSTRLGRPNWQQLDFQKYHRVINPLREEFFEMEMAEAPLALIGDYLGGNSLESAYLSARKLAEYWIYKYESVPATS